MARAKRRSWGRTRNWPELTNEESGLHHNQQVSGFRPTHLGLLVRHVDGLCVFNSRCISMVSSSSEANSWLFSGKPQRLVVCVKCVRQAYVSRTLCR